MKENVSVREFLPEKRNSAIINEKGKNNLQHQQGRGGEGTIIIE